MSDAKTAWNFLVESIGDFSGRGINHEKQNFTGNLSLKFGFPEKSLLLVSSATGDSDEVFHSENSLIGFDITGSLILYVASNNHPAITPHLFNRIEEGTSGEKKIVFRFGDIQDRNTFREEINFNFFPDGSIEHFYSWGLPGGDFEPRSGSKMLRK